MAFICYRPGKGSCRYCEHYKKDEDGKYACFANQEATAKESYFNFLERVRREGSVNMYGAAPNLIGEFHISRSEADEILKEWISHYGELAEKYHWVEE